MIEKVSSQIIPCHPFPYGYDHKHKTSLSALPSGLSGLYRKQRKKQILVVEDDPLILESMTFLLSDWGYQSHTFLSEETLNESLHQSCFSAPDLLLMDFVLSGPNDGVTLAKQICRYFKTRIPVLIITGSTNKQTLQCLNQNRFFQLHKPVLPRKLKNTLSTLIAE